MTRGCVVLILSSQMLIMYQIGLYYFSFDNYLCIMNLHVAGQFRILQHRLETMYRVHNKENSGGSAAENYYNVFKECVQQHQMLIEYCNKIGNVFNVFALIQVSMFSLLICVVGYMILMVSLLHYLLPQRIYWVEP